MGEQPKLTKQEPWELIQSFADSLNKDARLDEQYIDSEYARRSRAKLLQDSIAQKATLRNQNAGSSTDNGTIPQPSLSPASSAVERQVLKELEQKKTGSTATKVATTADPKTPYNNPYDRE